MSGNKCFFDHNMSPRLARALGELEGKRGVHVEHLRERFPTSISDIEWIKILSDEGGWFVVTEDNQIKQQKYERKAWLESGLPFVFLAGTWGNLKLWEEAWRFIKYWPKVKESINFHKPNTSFELSIYGKITIVK